MILRGDCLETLKTLPKESVQTCVTSPPYWGLRDYGCDGQLGLENSPEQFVENLVQVFREVHRLLKKDGTLWLNLGDSYAASAYGDKRTDYSKSPKQATNKGAINYHRKLNHGLKNKDLVGIPWRVAFALQADGWYLRQDIIWHKPNPMPESVRDRCTKAHEYIFLLSKSPKYYFDQEAIKEPAVHAGRIIKATGKASKNAQAGFGSDTKKGFTERDTLVRATRIKRSVWTVTTKPFKGAHFATFPVDLIEPCILAGSRPQDTVLDPFFGAGTVGVASKKHGRNFIGCELNPEYADIAEKRIGA